MLINNELLKQFRGSHEQLIEKLKLENLSNDPPSFSDLLVMVRREETRRSDKQARFKR